MILNLSDVLSEQHKAIHESVPIEMTCFKSEMGDYAITEKTPLELSVEYAGDRKLEVTGKAEITSVAPCDRCLEDVEVKVTLDFKHKIDTVRTKADQSAKWNRLSRNFEKREELKQKWPISWGQLKQTSLRLKKNEKSQIISTKSHRFGYPTDKYVKFKLVQSYSLYKQA